jgi:hypothetical protein
VYHSIHAGHQSLHKNDFAVTPDAIGYGANTKSKEEEKYWLCKMKAYACSL